jgi:hypothetical protein
VVLAGIELEGAEQRPHAGRLLLVHGDGSRPARGIDRVGGAGRMGARAEPAGRDLLLCG